MNEKTFKDSGVHIRASYPNYYLLRSFWTNRIFPRLDKYATTIETIVLTVIGLEIVTLIYLITN
jgi:hypothetical protein